MIECNGGWKCERCGMWFATKVEHYCWNAGDDLEQALTNLGITKERYIALKEALHLAPSCNCDARKQWLNDQSHKLQLAVADLSRILKIWYHKPR